MSYLGGKDAHEVPLLSLQLLSAEGHSEPSASGAPETHTV